MKKMVQWAKVMKRLAVAVGLPFALPLTFILPSPSIKLLDIVSFSAPCVFFLGWVIEGFTEKDKKE